MFSTVWSRRVVDELRGVGVCDDWVSVSPKLHALLATEQGASPEDPLTIDGVTFYSYYDDLGIDVQRFDTLVWVCQRAGAVCPGTSRSVLDTHFHYLAPPHLNPEERQVYVVLRGDGMDVIDAERAARLLAR